VYPTFTYSLTTYRDNVSGVSSVADLEQMRSCAS